MEDLGPPVAFPALAEGTPVYDPGGRRIGVVEQVLVEPPGGMFEGVIIHTVPLPGKHVRAMPDEIAEIRERGVVLAVGREELREEVARRRRRSRDRGQALEPPLERITRRVLDKLERFR